MKYNYNEKLGAFERRTGRKLWVTMHEAHRIVTMRDLGNSIGQIASKIDFKHKSKVSFNTVESVLRNVDSGDIVLSDDYVIDDDLFEEVDNNSRISALEVRVDNLEAIFLNNSCECDCHEESSIDKVKSWLRI